MNYDAYYPDEFLVTDGVLTHYYGNGGEVIIPAHVTKIDEYVFDKNNDITSVIIPPYLTDIGAGAFSDCVNLSKVTFTGTKLITIGNGAFYNCAFSELEIPDNTEVISTFVFAKNNQLKTITFPATLTNIGLFSLRNCPNLNEIIFKGTKTQWDNLNVNNLGISENCKVTCLTEEEKSISDLFISLPTYEYEYTGSPIKPVVTVKDGTQPLVKDTDYTVEYSDNVNAGTATVTVTGNGNYSGTQTVTFNILPKSIENAVISDIADQQYTGEAVTPAPTVKDGAKTLVLNKDYTVSYKNNIDAGTATVTIIGKGNYTGTKTATFKIVRSEAPAKTITVAEIPDQTYTGKAITPAVTVTDGVKTLVKGKDYIVSYSDNVEIGTATVVVTGIGDYEGVSKIVTFNIVKGSSPDPVVNANVVVTIDDNDKEYSDLTSAMKAIADASGDITITIGKNLTEAKSISVPKNASSITITADDATTLTLKNSTLSFKCPVTLENITLVKTNGKGIALTSGQSITMTDSSTGNVTATGRLELTDSTVNGKITAKGQLAMENCDTGAVTCSDKQNTAMIVDSRINGKITAAASLLIADSTVSGNISVKGNLIAVGEVTVTGSISTAGLASGEDGSVLSYTSLAVTKLGFSGENDLTLCVINKRGDAVPMTAGDKKSVAAKTFKGSFDAELLKISDDNCFDGQLNLVKTKLMVVS